MRSRARVSGLHRLRALQVALDRVERAIERKRIQMAEQVDSGSSSPNARGASEFDERRREFVRGLMSLEIATHRFDDPKYEWRRLFSELLGTFFLVLVGAGGGVVSALTHGAIGRAAAVTAPGAMVLAIILFMGAVGGAHLNPAVTFGFALRGDFPWRRVPGYIIAQLAGSTLAVVLLAVTFGRVGTAGGDITGTWHYGYASIDD